MHLPTLVPTEGQHGTQAPGSGGTAHRADGLSSEGGSRGLHGNAQKTTTRFLRLLDGFVQQDSSSGGAVRTVCLPAGPAEPDLKNFCRLHVTTSPCAMGPPFSGWQGSGG